jgi:AcrR family transcriptional regulator
MAMPTRKRLSAANWTSAALAALATGGVGAVAVEPLAAALGTTKGSFYWHFSGRDALLEAALQLWERTDTEDVITQVEAAPDPERRLQLLLTGAIAGRGGSVGAVELALQASADHPLVAPVLARVTRRRLDYLSEVFTQLDFAAPQARRRALLAYTAYLGHAQLAHATPDEAPRGPDLSGYLADVMATLTSRLTSR